ncbi:MAG: hypothetical protein AAFV93_18200 [Chloroflexota bacterium]
MGIQYEDNSDNSSILSNRLTLFRTLIVLGLVVIGVVVLLQNSGNLLDNVVPVETTEVDCIIGSEKSGFLSNEEVQNILARDYGISVSFQRMGSIEQVSIDPGNNDCLWPSNASGVEIFVANNPAYAGNFSDEIIFNSPIVLYSWQEVVDGLLAEGLITENPDTGILTVDTFQLVDILTMEERPSWNELGVDELFGSFNLITTDPTRSNSGNMFYALMANILNGGDVTNETTIQPYLPTIGAYYERQGRLEESSGFLYEQFTRLGIGTYPIIANYESLLIEFSLDNPEQIDTIMQRIRIIYPTPTVWSSHPLIALTDDGERLLEAVQDERIQEIAWEQHGFRSGLIGAQNDPSVFGIEGIANEVNSVIPLPRADAIISMLEFLNADN